MSLTTFREHLEREGSTRPVALMRAGLGLVIWSRFAAELLPYHHESAEMWAIAGLFFVCSTAMVLGLWARISTASTAAVLSWMVVRHGWFGSHEPWRHHHVHLLVQGTILLSFTPCGRSFSVDRWLAMRRGEAWEERGPLWAVPLIALQVSVVYFFSAIDKTHVRFISGEHLLGVFGQFYTGSDPVTVPGWLWWCRIASWGVLLIEYILPFALFVRRWHRWVIPLGLLFHGVLYVALPVSTFSVTMAVLYLAYADPDTVDALTR